jgi:hypothetical protein
MSQSDQLARTDAAANVTERDKMISRYKRLREVGRELNSKLVKRLSKDVLDEGGKKLGILQGGTFVFNSEDESSILMDYCIYDVRRKGRNAVEQYLIDSAADPESDEMVCLRVMQHAIYSVFIVESVDPGLGVTVRDVFSNKTILIVDMGFSNSAVPGLILASRLLFHEDFAVTGGTALPVGVPPDDQRQAITKEFAGAFATSDDGDFDPAPLIRECLNQGCSSDIQYQQPTGRAIGRCPAPGSQRPALGSHHPATVGRNARCPCGSGRKFKHCCMKRS